MKKAIILSFVLALFNIAFSSAQSISRPASDKAKQEKQVDKSVPAEAHPKTGNTMPKPAGQIENGKKSKEAGKNKQKGQHKHKAKSKKGRAKTQQNDKEMEGHKGHDHGKSGKTADDNTKKTEKNSKPPVISPNSGKPQKQSEKN